MLEIREAGEDDAPALAATIKSAFAEYEGVLDPPSSAHAKTAEVVRRELAGGAALIALVDGSVAGCVFYHPRHDHLYLDRLAVLPEFRGRRLSRELISAVEARAAALGLDRVRLSVRLALAENRAYYERLGYQFFAFGYHAGYPEPTFVTLQKPLAS